MYSYKKSVFSVLIFMCLTPGHPKQKVNPDFIFVSKKVHADFTLLYGQREKKIEFCLGFVTPFVLASVCVARK